LPLGKGDFGFGNKAPPTPGKEPQTPPRFAVRSLLARDPWKIATWQNVHHLARDICAGAQAAFADAIDCLQPKRLGFKGVETRELDVLRALRAARGVRRTAGSGRGLHGVAEDLRQRLVEAGG
jgi:hypothetical protein